MDAQPEPEVEGLATGSDRQRHGLEWRPVRLVARPNFLAGWLPMAELADMLVDGSQADHRQSMPWWVGSRIVLQALLRRILEHHVAITAAD